MRDPIHHEPGYQVISRANNAAKRREWYGSKYPVKKLTNLESVFIAVAITAILIFLAIHQRV
jgi:hypothetical protein